MEILNCPFYFIFIYYLNKTQLCQIVKWKKWWQVKKKLFQIVKQFERKKCFTFVWLSHPNSTWDLNRFSKRFKFVLTAFCLTKHLCLFLGKNWRCFFLSFFRVKKNFVWWLSILVFRCFRFRCKKNWKKIKSRFLNVQPRMRFTKTFLKRTT